MSLIFSYSSIINSLNHLSLYNAYSYKTQIREGGKLEEKNN